MMDLNNYQKKAVSTAIYPEEYRIVYPTLGLNGEAGEVAEKVKKHIRQDVYTGGVHDKELIYQFKLNTAKELGDVLWYVANLAHDLGYTLSEIAEMNIEKLADRKEKGKLKGSGDDR